MCSSDLPAVLEHVEPAPVATEQQCLDAPSDSCVILEEEAIANGRPCTDLGGKNILQNEDTTAESGNSGDNGVQAITTAVRVATRVVDAITQYRLGTTATDENKHFDRGKEQSPYSFPSWERPRLAYFFVFSAFPVLSVFFCFVCTSAIPIFLIQVTNEHRNQLI